MERGIKFQSRHLKKGIDLSLALDISIGLDTPSKATIRYDMIPKTNHKHTHRGAAGGAAGGKTENLQPRIHTYIYFYLTICIYLPT